MADEKGTTATGTIATTWHYYVYTGCPYKGQCRDEGGRCASCKWGKRSYYEPAEPNSPPYIPYPWYPYTNPWITYDVIYQ